MDISFKFENELFYDELIHTMDEKMRADNKKPEVKFIVTDEYREWIALIKDRIKNSQIKASIKVNRELLELYWHIGEDIVNRQKHSKWGEGLLRQMSIDLKKTFPDMAGFSETNLKTMRLWYRFYAEAVNGQQVVDELRSDDIFRLITTIPWGHNQRIIFKCKDVREAVFYAQYTLENNWSRDVSKEQHFIQHEPSGLEGYFSALLEKALFCGLCRHAITLLICDKKARQTQLAAR